MLPKQLVALVMCVFEESPLVGHVRKREATVTAGGDTKTREDIFIK